MMKVMLVCTAGMSTSLVMNKIDRYAKENNIDMELKAYPLQEYHEHVQEYDIILLGPQISYKCEEIRKNVKLPVAIIDSLDYALGKADQIISMIKTILEKGEKL